MFRPTLLVKVCEADGRGLGSTGAQGETEAPGPQGRSGTPFLTWVKLSRNAWRDVHVRERFAGRGALPTHLILDLAMNFKHSAHLPDTAEGPAHPERTPPCLALQLASSGTTGRKWAGSTHSGGQHLPLEEGSPARTSRSSGGDPTSCQLPLWTEINGGVTALQKMMGN